MHLNSCTSFLMYVLRERLGTSILIKATTSHHTTFRHITSLDTTSQHNTAHRTILLHIPTNIIIRTYLYVYIDNIYKYTYQRINLNWGEDGVRDLMLGKRSECKGGPRGRSSCFWSPGRVSCFWCRNVTS